MASRRLDEDMQKVADAAWLLSRDSCCTDLPDFVYMLKGKLSQLCIMLLSQKLFQGDVAKLSRFNAKPQACLNRARAGGLKASRAFWVCSGRLFIADYAASKRLCKAAQSRNPCFLPFAFSMMSGMVTFGRSERRDSAFACCKSSNHS